MKSTYLFRRFKRGGVSSSQMSAPLPPTSTLEEVRRRLTKKPPPLAPIGLQPTTQLPSALSPSGVGYSSTTLPRHHSPPSSEDSISSKECISSFVIYDDSEVPFVLKIPKMKGGLSSGVTLAAFKEHLPKKGHYRYFFKTECPELDAQVVQEEVIDDYQVYFHAILMINISD
jgi:axin 1